MSEFAITDPWRFFNPTGKVYSFFSHVHHTFTRIDYFMVDDRLLPSLSSCSYEATVISDHAPVVMSIRFKGYVQNVSSHQIPRIQTSSDITIDPQRINDEFRDYYASLYTSETGSDMQDLEFFFATLEVPLVHPDMIEDLEKPVTAAELSVAITSMQGGKCPGPDGYPLEFYRKFQHKLAPVLIDMFSESFNSISLPPTLNQASISLI